LFIKGFAEISSSLYKLTHKKAIFAWTTEHDKKFQQLIEKLINAPTLAFPDFSKRFKVETDACEYGMGAILSQKQDGADQPIAYFSKSLNKAERNYSTTEKEALTIIAAVKQFRPYIYGHEFYYCNRPQTIKVVRVDAKPTEQSRLMDYGITTISL
jgi:hypothetical protein